MYQLGLHRFTKAGLQWLPVESRVEICKPAACVLGSWRIQWEIVGLELIAEFNTCPCSEVKGLHGRLESLC